MNALSIRQLTKTYKTNENSVHALRGIDLEVTSGDFFALLGPNGAGKSTAIGIICSLLNPTSGEVSIFGHDLVTEREAAKSLIGLVPQEFNFNVFETVLNVVTNVAGYNGIGWLEANERAEYILKRLDLWGKKDTPGRQLSGGMKRRLMIARALIHQPKLLILDEPTAGVDIEIRRSMWEYLTEINEQDGTTIILTTHYLEEAEALCRNVAIIDGGEIIENGQVAELLSRATMETYVLDMIERPALSSTQLGPFALRYRDDGALEVDIPKGHTLNELLSSLGEAGVQVSSMRNKSNRLEQLFLQLVDRDVNEEHDADAEADSASATNSNAKDGGL